MLGIEDRSEGVGAERGRECRSGLEKLNHGKCARIGEHDARIVLQLENEAREPGKRRPRSDHLPVAGHAKVDVQYGAVIEVHQLMLPLSLDAHDRSPNKTRETRATHSSPDGRMEDSGSTDAHTDGRARQRARRSLDFG
jgi:hypothetical protein